MENKALTFKQRLVREILMNIPTETETNLNYLNIPMLQRRIEKYRENPDWIVFEGHMDRYIPGKGICAGVFFEGDLDAGRDKQAVEAVMRETGLKYTNTEYIQRGKRIVGLKVYVCDLEDFKLEEDI